MVRYQMQDGAVVDTANATKSWDEATTWNGNNHISVATGSQWNHQRLHRSRRGRYWLESWSQWQGTTAHAEWLDERAAARWLLANEHEVPEELAAVADEVLD
jgi:hypothetical protein